MPFAQITLASRFMFLAQTTFCGTETALQLAMHPVMSQRALRLEPRVGFAPAGTVCGCDLFLRVPAFPAAASRGQADRQW